MKKIILQASAIMCLIAFQACGDSKKESPKQAAKEHFKLKSSFHVPLSEAEDDIDRYTTTAYKAFERVPIRAYTIHAEDLLQVLGMNISDSVLCQYKYVRAYIGMDSLDQFKLYLTPVTGANLSVTPKIAGTDVILSDEGGQYVLDLNAPCPMTCDYTSPLYKAIKGE